MFCKFSESQGALFIYRCLPCSISHGGKHTPEQKSNVKESPLSFVNFAHEFTQNARKSDFRLKQKYLHQRYSIKCNRVIRGNWIYLSQEKTVLFALRYLKIKDRTSFVWVGLSVGLHNIPDLLKDNYGSVQRIVSVHKVNDWLMKMRTIYLYDYSSLYKSDILLRWNSKASIILYFQWFFKIFLFLFFILFKHSFFMPLIAQTREEPIISS